jgi:uncharacterized protein YhbP (UPF0306 family)
MSSTKNNTGKKDSTKPPNGRQLKQLAEELIQEQNTVTLATVSENIPWAASVYYSNIGFSLYFFSDPASRHVQEALKAKQAAGAIFHPASTWREIRGVQTTGLIEPLSPGIEALRALRRYLRKFPFTEDFFGSGQKMDLEGFAKRFKVRFYRFQPTLLYYLDNRIRFSFREKIPL